METKKSSEFKIGEIVVYPKHGVGEITKIENMEVANIKHRLKLLDCSDGHIFNHSQSML